MKHIRSDTEKDSKAIKMNILRNHCIRCGECCHKASPTLQMIDLPLVKNNSIKWNRLYTIRRGELVNDNINDGLIVTHTELIKVKEKDAGKGGCIYYDEGGKACSIYKQRPAQCSALKCWDTKELLKVHSGAKLERKHIIKDKMLLGIIEQHEKRCGYSTLDKYVKQIEVSGEKAVEKILDLLQVDHHLRPFMSEKLGLKSDEMDLFFGRPLIKTINMFGLKVIREHDGAFLLTVI